MNTDNLQLDDASRTKLDGIVQTMASQNAPVEDVQAVVNDYKQKYGKPAQQNTSQQSGGPVPTFALASENDSPIIAGAKTLANVIPSATNFAIGAIKTPIMGLAHMAEIPGQAYNLVKEQGIVPALENSAKGLYETVIPESARDFFSGIGSYITGNGNAGDEKFKNVQKLLTNDPIGQIAPWLLLGREAIAKFAPESLTTFDNAISKVGYPGAKAVNAIAGLPGKAIGGLGTLGKFSAGQAMGLDPSTMTEVINSDKGTFSKANIATVDRPTVAGRIKTALDAREESLSETGQAYKPIRDSKTAVVLDPDFLKNELERTTGTKIVEQAPAKTAKGELPTVQLGETKAGKPGTIESSGSASIRDPKDVRALQNFYNTWQPYFDKGEMTQGEFLNMRTDLAKLSKFDREITKSGDLEATSKQIRANLNNAYRSQIPGLEDTDATYSSQILDLQNLRKGILDKNGDLTDASINKIANATNKGRSVFLDQLEEISPGITKRVKVLKAIEDIERTGGQKVGTYARSVIGPGGIMVGLGTGNIPLLAGAIAETILASPNVTVPLLRAYGFNKALVSAVVEQLKSGAGTVNQLPNTMKNPTLQGIMPTLK